MASMNSSSETIRYFACRLNQKPPYYGLTNNTYITYIKCKVCNSSISVSSCDVSRADCYFCHRYTAFIRFRTVYQEVAIINENFEIRADIIYSLQNIEIAFERALHNKIFSFNNEQADNVWSVIKNKILTITDNDYHFFKLNDNENCKYLDRFLKTFLLFS